MPVTQAERKRVASHTYREDKRKETDTVYDIPPALSTSAILSSGFSELDKKLVAIAFYLPEGIAFAAYLFLLFNTSSFILALEYTAAFLVFQFLISSIFDSEAAATFTGAPFSKPLSAITLSVNYLKPLAYVILIWMLIFAVRYQGILQLSALPFYIILIVGFIVVFLLHLVNINNSISPHALYSEKGLSRSTAMNRSWTSLSNQSLTLIVANFISYLPVILLTITYAYTLNVYVLAADFVFFIFCAALWQSVISGVFLYVKSHKREFDYSKI